MSDRDGSRAGASGVGHPSSVNAVIAVHRKDIDLTLLRENLRLTPEERIQKLFAVLELVDEVRKAGGSRS